MTYKWSRREDQTYFDQLRKSLASRECRHEAIDFITLPLDHVCECPDCGTILDCDRNVRGATS